MNSARQEILNKLRNTNNMLETEPDLVSPVFRDIERPLELSFKRALELVNGSVHVFSSEQEPYEYLKKFVSAYKTEDIFCDESDLKGKLTRFGIEYQSNGNFQGTVQFGLTGCEYLIAHTGSVMVSSAQIGGRKLFVYPEIHIIIASKSQLVENLEAAYGGMLERYTDRLPSQIVLITGPSRTADIEKTLTIGAHGPKELHVLLY